MFLMGAVVAASASLAFALGIRSGPIGLARAYAISNAVIAYPVLLMGHRACNLDIKKTIAESAPLVFCALLMGGIVWLVGVGCGAASIGSHSRLAVKIVVGIAIYLACLRQFARPTYSEILAHVSR
jgi:hypothetical protein